MNILPKIDIHVHAVPYGFLNRPSGETYATPQQLRVIYDRYNIECGNLLPDGICPACADDVCSMREAYEMVRDYPETLGWWFCSIQPRMGSNLPDTDLSFYLLQYKAHGARGVGEITENMPFDDPFMLNLFHHCEKCDMPVLFHIGASGGGDYGIIDDPGLPRLEKVLGMFPRLKFLGHSQKFWAEIGVCDPKERGSYPTGKVISGRVPELMRKYPNLYGDLLAGSGYNALARDPEFAYTFLEEFQDRLFFGTDICAPSNISSDMLKLSAFLDDAMTRGKISYAAYEKISRGNALELLERT